MLTVPAARFQSARVAEFKESVIREMTRLALEFGAVNLAQGFPDFPAPAELKHAAQVAIAGDFNQYSITWGAKAFRDAICSYYQRFYNILLDPERELTVCCGSTEGMIATLLALLNPGDEVVLFEPFYENYWPDSQLSGAICRYVPLRAPDWTFDPDQLRAAFNARTRAVILNTPNNPTGRVFSESELRMIAGLCEEFDCLLITDEIYEHITFDGAHHVPAITIPGMRDRCVLVNSLSKTFSVTGWRVGWVIAAPELTNSIRKVHDFLTVGAATPLQMAGVTALALPDEYYSNLAIWRSVMRATETCSSGFWNGPAFGVTYRAAHTTSCATFRSSTFPMTLNSRATWSKRLELRLYRARVSFPIPPRART